MTFSRRALLEVIVTRLATSPDAISDYSRKTLLYHSSDVATVDDCVQSSLDNLLKVGFVKLDDTLNYQATNLGSAVVNSSFDPDDGVFIHNELKRALKSFVMDGDMHILYTFSPVQDFGNPVNWQVFRNEMDAMNESGLRVLTLLGLKPTVVHKL
jgi:replicative superfamily II helicase